MQQARSYCDKRNNNELVVKWKFKLIESIALPYDILKLIVKMHNQIITNIILVYIM